MTPERRARAFDAVERATAVPMVALSVIFIALFIIPLVVALPGRIGTTFAAAEWVVWACFAAELAVKTCLAPRWGRYLMRHWFDALIVVVPFLRPLRIVRSLRLLRGLRMVRFLALGVGLATEVRTVLRRHGLHYALLVGGVLFVGAASAVTFLEHGAEGGVANFGDALWWASATVTTVGYGDVTPVTAEGRGVGVFLMFVGIALYSFLTANVAAFLVESSERNRATTTLDDVMAQLRRLEDQLNHLREPAAS